VETPHASGSQTRRALRAVAGIAVVLATSVLVAPPGTHARVLALTASAACAGLALARRAHGLSGQHARPWWLLAAGCTAFAGGNVLRVLEGGDAPLSFPSPAHLLHAAALLALAAALISIASARVGTDTPAVLDAVTIGVSSGLATWSSLIEPALATTDRSVDRLVVVALPVAGTVALVALWHLLLLTGAPRRAERCLLAGSLTAILGTAALSSGHHRTLGSVLTALLWVGTFTSFALAATLPSAGAVTAPSPPVTSALARRVAGLALATVLLPSSLLLRSTGAVDLLLAAGAALVLATVTVRVTLLLRDAQQRVDADLRAVRRRDQRRFEAMVRHATDVLLVLDRRGDVTWASPSATPLFGEPPVGWTRAQLIAQLHPEERSATLGTLLERIATSDGSPIHLGARLADPTRERHIELVAVDLLDDPAVEGVILTVRETTERAELEAELRSLAFQDPLTGLANRELFTERLARAVARSRRTGHRLAVLLVDLDDFKDVNDTLGHPVGDELLREVARRFTERTRATDTVARLGGDEFAVLCEDLDLTRDAVATAQRLLGALTAPLAIAGTVRSIGASIGIAVDGGERSPDELLRDADIALYEAKGSGKRGWALHRAAMTATAQARLELAGDLTDAIANGELDLAYQPIVELATGRVMGVEVLARWHHPIRGPVPPSEFIALAEAGGQIVPLGDLVLDRAIATFAGWQAQIPDLDLRIAVNVSTRQLRDPGLVARVAAVLAEHGVSPGSLVLELTESSILEDADQALQVLQELRTLGVRFALDDFGTGYSSLSYLRLLPVDIVKIDRSFIADLDAEVPASSDLVRAILDLGTTLRLDIAAEGIETEQQRQVLTRLGCTYGQGYLFSRPTDAAGIELLLTTPAPLTSG
jgi:diguanylate cyclase (GGDEF)-like protein